MRGILTWHSVDDSGSVISVTRSEFERQLDAIARRGLEVVPLRELVDRANEADAVALTFDDGFLNFLEIAEPALTERGFPATVFIVTGHVGGRNDWHSDEMDAGVPLLPLMGWDDLRSLAARGFEIGGHSVSHRRLDRLSSADRQREIAGCRESLALKLETDPYAFAFPYGACDDDSVVAASQVFSVTCTTELSVLSKRESRHALPRLDTYYFRDSTLLEDWGTPRFRSYVAIRNAGRRVRSAFRFGR